MAYKFVNEPVTWMDMIWSDLDDEGFVRENQIRMKVVLLPLDEVTPIANGHSEEPTIDFVKRVSRDWSQILGPDEKPFPFIPENLERMVQKPGFGTGFPLSYLRAWGGKGKVREKNSEGSPPDGPAGEAPKAKKVRPRRRRTS
jgi:hypothetical protein